MRYYSRLLIFVLLTLSFYACSKDPELESVKPSTFADTPEGNYEAFWHGVNRNYAFFNYDPTDWNKMYHTMKVRVNASTTEAQLLDIYSEMMAKLIDNHRTIHNSADSVIYSHFRAYPYPRTLNLNNIKKNYAKIFQVEHGGRIGYGAINNDILWVWRNDMKLDQQKLDSVMQLRDWKGVIIDLRGNGGGFFKEVNKVVSTFSPNDFLYGYKRYLISNDQFSLGPFIGQYITRENKAGKALYQKSVVVLTDRWTGSAAEHTAIAMKLLPNVMVVGDTTAGALGSVNTKPDISYYGGAFALPNGWWVRLANEVFYAGPGKTMLEGKGVAPDVRVVNTPEEIAQGRDKMLEEAIIRLQ
jgi:carboxyl-terminal processing protease